MGPGSGLDPVSGEAPLGRVLKGPMSGQKAASKWG